MINSTMRTYDYYQYDQRDEYGQPALGEAKGQIKIAIFNVNKVVTDDIKYTGEDFVGFTYDKDVNNTYVIQYGNERLKVLYTIAAPKLKTQVFMKRM